jgi:hypothetical protein
VKPRAVTTRRRLIAAIGSFGVYAIPLVGPHALSFLGESLLQGLQSNRPLAWTAVNMAVALAAQVLAGVVLYWSLGGARVRTIAWLAVIPLTAALNVAYMSEIPALFLIEADTAPERNSWTEHCFVRGAELRPVRTPVTPASPRPRAWWAALPPDGRDTLLRVPGCSLTQAVLPKAGQNPEGHLDFFTSLQFASPAGVAVVEQLDRRTSRRTWSLLVEPGAPLQPLAASSDRHLSPPVLSHRGDAVAYLETVVGTGPPVLHRVRVRRTNPQSAAPEVQVDLARLGPASYVLMDVDTQTREILAWRNDRPLIVGFDGQWRPAPFEPGEIRAQYSTYLRLGQGWVAWDAYREDGPYQIGWSLPVGAGRRRTNTGRSITSAAVDPTGRFIAVSETTTLSIGNARDVVYVLRTDTGADVFRTYLPRYTRSQVVFFDEALFGYSNLAGTRILKVPEAQ